MPERDFLNEAHNFYNYFKGIQEGSIIVNKVTFYGTENKYPNDLIPWEVFLWGKENGYKLLDFGGAGKPDIPYGVREYKRKFGGELVNYGRFTHIHKPILMAFGIFVLWIWQKCSK